MSAAAKIKQFISRTLGIESKWNLTEDGHLDIASEELERIQQEYGEDFVGKFEKLLSEENQNTNNQIQTEMPKILTLALVCAVLGVKELQAADDGSVTLNEEQLNALEAELKKLQAEKAAAETNLATANTERETAENALSGVTDALDELGETVKAAATPAAKVEAVRKKLAEKPGAAATQIQTQGDQSRKTIDGADPVTSYARGLV